jgi:RNA polymerase sigma factor (sigma-70 family)
MTNWVNTITGCKKNEAKAQRELYDQFKARLMGLCRRYAGTREEAQDILQEVFVKIFSKIHQLAEIEKLESWMMRIAVTTAINHYHKNKRISYSGISEETENENSELVVSNVSDEYLIGLINALPDGCRLVFNLNVVEGYSHVEIAELLNITESTSRSQLHHAKGILKVKLKAVGVGRYEKYA